MTTWNASRTLKCADCGRKIELGEEFIWNQQYILLQGETVIDMIPVCMECAKEDNGRTDEGKE